MMGSRNNKRVFIDLLSDSDEESSLTGGSPSKRLRSGQKILPAAHTSISAVAALRPFRQQASPASDDATTPRRFPRNASRQSQASLVAPQKSPAAAAAARTASSNRKPLYWDYSDNHDLDSDEDDQIQMALFMSLSSSTKKTTVKARSSKPPAQTSSVDIHPAGPRPAAAKVPQSPSSSDEGEESGSPPHSTAAINSSSLKGAASLISKPLASSSSSSDSETQSPQKVAAVSSFLKQDDEDSGDNTSSLKRAASLSSKPFSSSSPSLNETETQNPQKVDAAKSSLKRDDEGSNDSFTKISASPSAKKAFPTTQPAAVQPQAVVDLSLPKKRCAATTTDGPTCARCTFVNPADDTACVVCAAPLVASAAGPLDKDSTEDLVVDSDMMKLQEQLLRNVRRKKKKRERLKQGHGREDMVMAQRVQQEEKQHGEKRGTAGVTSHSSIRDDELLAQKLQLEESKRLEQFQKRTEQEHVKMLSSNEGRAWVIAEKVINLHKTISSGPDDCNCVEPLSIDDTVFLAEKFLACQESFKLAGKPCHVEVAYHYTHKKNIKSIREGGLMTTHDRKSNNIQSERERFSQAAGHYGHGLYTALSPYPFLNKYGDTGLLLLIVKGETKYVSRDEALLVGNHIDCIIGNKLVDAKYCSADSELGHYHDEVVLKKSSQCLPLLHFPASVVSLDDDNAPPNELLWKFHQGLQKIADGFIHEAAAKPTALKRVVPSVYQKYKRSLRVARAASWPPVAVQAPSAVPQQALQQLLQLQQPPAPFVQQQAQAAALSAAQPTVQGVHLPTRRSQSEAQVRGLDAHGLSTKLTRVTIKDQGRAFLQSLPVLRSTKQAAVSSQQMTTLVAAGRAGHMPPPPPAGGANPLPSFPPVPPPGVPRGSFIPHSRRSVLPVGPSSQSSVLPYQAPSTADLGGGIPQDALKRVRSRDRMDEACPICMDSLSRSVVRLKACNHQYHRRCIEEALGKTRKCPVCRVAVGEPQGSCPCGSMHVSTTSHACGGYESVGTIKIIYSLPNGTQLSYHQHPGQPYTGMTRTAYLPDNAEGRSLLKRLKYAWSHGLTFTIGTSLTNGRQNMVVWSSIHHKTSPNGGSHGFPDPSYFQNCNSELDALGVPPEQDCSY